MKSVVFGLKSLVLMILASFVAMCITYVGFTYVGGAVLIWEWKAVFIFSCVVGWAMSWVPFAVLMWFEEKE